MAKKTPTVKETSLVKYDPEADRVDYICDIVSDWQVWQAWLNDPENKSVRFVAADGTSCTLIKEYRKHFGGEERPLWIAHKRLGQLRTKYVGKSANCDYERLKAVAFELSQRKLVD